MDKYIKINVKNWEILNSDKNKRLIRFSFKNDIHYSFYVEKRKWMFGKWKTITFGAFGVSDVGYSIFTKYDIIFNLYNKL